MFSRIKHLWLASLAAWGPHTYYVYMYVYIYIYIHNIWPPGVFSPTTTENII